MNRTRPVGNHAAYPDVVVNARAMTTLEQSEALRTGHLDAGILRPVTALHGLTTRVISRDGSTPSTRASASVPARSSDSTAIREMNVTPKPPITAVLTDSCRPSSRWTSKSQSPVTRRPPDV